MNDLLTARPRHGRRASPRPVPPAHIAPNTTSRPRLMLGKPGRTIRFRAGPAASGAAAGHPRQRAVACSRPRGCNPLRPDRATLALVRTPRGRARGAVPDGHRDFPPRGHRRRTRSKPLAGRRDVIDDNRSTRSGAPSARRVTCTHPPVHEGHLRRQPHASQRCERLVPRRRSDSRGDLIDLGDRARGLVSLTREPCGRPIAAGLLHRRPRSLAPGTSGRPLRGDEP